MVYQFMKENRGRYPAGKTAGLFGASCGAYYRRARYGVSERRRTADAELVCLIREIQSARHRRYGSPRVREELRRVYGKRASRKKVARLMREQGLNARRKRRFIPAASSNHGLSVCENLLNREFHAGQGGEKRVSDITCLRTRDGWVYLTVVPGLYDRKVIGRALGAGMEAAHTAIPALDMAFRNRRAQAGLLFHSGRGVQYCARSFRGLLEKRCPTVRQSMCRKGNC